MRIFLLHIFLLFINYSWCQGCMENIYISIPGKDYPKQMRIKIYYTREDTIASILFGSITEQSKKDFASFFLDLSNSAKLVDTTFFARNNISTPEMIMDSLTKYRFDYERKNRGNFYVIIKGQGPIWYLHKVTLTYIWTPDETQEDRKVQKEKIKKLNL